MSLSNTSVPIFSLYERKYSNDHLLAIMCLFLVKILIYTNSEISSDTRVPLFLKNYEDRQEMS